MESLGKWNKRRRSINLKRTRKRSTVKDSV